MAREFRELLEAMSPESQQRIVNRAIELQRQMLGITVWAVHSANGVEQRRTDLKVAEQDVDLFWSICHRKAWIEEEVR